MSYFLAIPLALLMTFCGTFGAMCFKRVTGSVQKTSLITRFFMSRWLYVGGGLYLFASGVNVMLLKYFDYSIVYPLTALTYVWTLIFSRIILKEQLNICKILAITLIITGIIIITV